MAKIPFNEKPDWFYGLDEYHETKKTVRYGDLLVYAIALVLAILVCKYYIFQI